MKFFSLFILSSFFVIAYGTPIPEQDKKYLKQERDENNYGCVDWDIIGPGRSIQKPDGTWEDRHPEKVCRRYCRQTRPGDMEKIHVRCFGPTVSMKRNKYDSYSKFWCVGVGDTQEEAIAEAKSICIYKLRQECERTDDCVFKNRVSWGSLVSCSPVGICFDVFYEDGRILIEK